MEDFNAYLAKATAKGSNNVPGAVLAVVDKDGTLVYKNVAGYNGVGTDAKPLEFDQTFFIASCTKLIASIASLQVVERGLIGLDDPVDEYLPELASQPILSLKADGSFELQKSTKPITLRQLITHTSGASYDWISSKLIAWRLSRGEAPALVENGDIAKGFAYPRVFEAGERWEYGGGLDWAGLLVARLTKMSLEDHVEENIAKPLGIKSFTWYLSRKPEVAHKIMNFSTRREDGILVEGPTPFWSSEPVGEGGGIGMYANVSDFSKVLSDLLKSEPRILRKETLDHMFAPQLPEDSGALKVLQENGDGGYKCAFDDSLEGVNVNYGLGGLLLMDDVKRENYFKPKGTLSWSGLPNLSWSINRERGLATIFATQVLPWTDRKSWDLIARFETAVWRNLKA